MGASTTAGPLSGSLEAPPWKSIVSHVAGFLIALIFISSGVWKISDPLVWSRFMEEFLLPVWITVPFTLALAITETLGGVLILVPRFRRWGAVISSLLLISFMAYIGLYYPQLVGKDCSCFPIVKRTVGPMLFVGDGAMLVAAILAGWFAKPSQGVRTAAMILGAVIVFAGVSFGSALAHQTGAKAPDSIVVDGKPFSLQHGRIFIFFFDPECTHCNDAARHMGTYHWKSGITIIGVPTREPQFDRIFMSDNKLNGITSLDYQKLKAAFPFADPPYGVAIENGREVGPVAHYDDEDNGAEPAATLKKLGYID
jgi:uncharacterized membrane protein YphA (DoxX/SURF4 family)